MSVLVTGGAGFIGSHLVEALVARGQEVTVLDDLSTGRLANLQAVRDRIRFVEGSVLDPAALAVAIQGARTVFHLAAIPSVAVSMEDPLGTHEANATGTLRVLAAARKVGARRFVLASSSAVYGDAVEMPCRETHLPRPLSPYAAQKHASEMYARVYATGLGVETVALRFFNVFGPRQDPTSHYSAAIPRFITAALAGQAPTIHGDGEQTRDFVHVGRVVEALLLAASAPAASVSGRTFNIASGTSVSINRLVEVIREITGSAAPPIHGTPREGDVRHSTASIDAARAALKFTLPPDALERDLKQTIAWYQEKATR